LFSLQWRDRAGFSPASLFSRGERELKAFCWERALTHFLYVTAWKLPLTLMQGKACATAIQNPENTSPILNETTVTATGS
jgi:hypothetical protein